VEGNNGGKKNAETDGGFESFVRGGMTHENVPIRRKKKAILLVDKEGFSFLGRKGKGGAGETFCEKHGGRS